MSGATRRARRAAARRLRRDLPWNREFAIVGPTETRIHIPAVGALFVSKVDGLVVIEAAAYSGPGVAERKAVLEDLLRASGFGDAIAAAQRRARSAS